MIFAIIHRHLEREWEDQGEVMGIILKNWRCWSLWKIYSSAKFRRGKEINFCFKLIIALEHLGAKEQWSFWSMAQLRIALLVCFMVFSFHYFFLIA